MLYYNPFLLETDFVYQCKYYHYHGESTQNQVDNHQVDVSDDIPDKMYKFVASYTLRQDVENLTHIMNGTIVKVY